MQQREGLDRTSKVLENTQKFNIKTFHIAQPFPTENEDYLLGLVFKKVNLLKIAPKTCMGGGITFS